MSVQPREICFRLYEGETALAEGRATVTTNREVSCFGHFREVALEGGGRLPAFYEGVILEHNLNDDETASVSFKYYAVQPCSESPIGYKQVEAARLALSMGKDSGVAEPESLMLGDSLQLVLETYGYT